MGENIGDGRHQERRRHPQAGQSPTDILRQLPALVVLQRMPVPVLAVDDDGTITRSARLSARGRPRGRSAPRRDHPQPETEALTC